jgi:hypothetical protein
MVGKLGVKPATHWIFGIRERRTTGSPPLLALTRSIFEIFASYVLQAAIPPVAALNSHELRPIQPYLRSFLTTDPGLPLIRVTSFTPTTTASPSI